MKSTSILIKVSDEVYDSVVAPRKKEKSFTKLVETLLNGYYSNEMVRNFVTGQEEGLFEESYREFDSALSEVRSSMSRLGFASSELESTTMEGKDYFSEKQKNDGEDKGYVNEEFEDLKNQVSEMVKQNAEILSMLRGLGNARIDVSRSAVTQVEVPVNETNAMSVAGETEGSDGFDADDLFSDMGLDFSGSGFVDKEEEDSASDVMSSIMSNVGEEY